MKLLVVAWWLKGWHINLSGKGRISMSRWQIIGKSRTAMAILLVLSCMLLFQACSADDENCAYPHLTDVEHYVDCDYDFYVSFHSEHGLSGQINGFWVFFDENVIADPGFNKDCVKIKWDDGTWKSAQMSLLSRGHSLSIPELRSL